MPLETGTYISDLNASNPVGASDPKSAGDDHIRLVKSTILATFPSVTGAITLTHTQINDAAIKSEANTFLASVTVSNANAILRIIESDASADNGYWYGFQASSEALYIGRTLSDDQLTANNPIIINRTGITIDSIALAGTAITLVGTMTLTGATNIVGALTATSFGGITSANLVDKSASETISGATWDFQAITAVSFGGIASANLVDKSASETISGATWDFQAITAVSFGGIASTNLLDETAAIDTTVSNTSAAQPGYKGTPQRVIGSSDSLVLTDCGKQIYLNAGSAQTLTIPANASVAFPIGTIIPVINDSGNDWSIAITTDTLEELATGNTGTRTLADNNKAILEKVTATLWKYSASV